MKRDRLGLHLYVDFEITRCANAAACNQRCLIVSDPATGIGMRLTGSCDGPHEIVKAYRVERARLLEALGVPK